MNSFFTFLMQNAPYILSVITAFFALRIAWDSYKSNASPLGAISRGIGMFITFFIIINFLPWMFSYGVNQAYGHFKESTVASNLIAIGKGASDMLVTAKSAEVNLEIPETEALSDVAANAIESISAPAAVAPAASNSRPAETQAAAAERNYNPAPVAPATNNTLGPMSNNGFAPSYHELEKPAVTGSVELVPRNLSAEEVQGLPNYSNPNLISPGVTKDDGGPQTYTVKSGDSMAKIAKMFDSDVRALCAANAGIVRNCNIIRSGMVLTIP